LIKIVSQDHINDFVCMGTCGGRELISSVLTWLL